ncbi:MAG: ABC transporter ATP-binding protein [Firmicutes bacterium]|nr:ABC transporter ATP-binding protein [Bacillota bacterium]
MNILSINDISKKYPGFKLENISFDVAKGTIMGLIGRNGAGKSTTLKAILNMVHADRGRVSYFDLDLKENERAIKQRIGFAGGEIDFYKKKKIKDILNITKRFYDDWDEELCIKYMKMFSLDENKTPSELSSGMKVKLNLVMALSHGAELLILDEPTSGLDPVSRDELLEIFKHLKKQGVTILFSTHITSDLEKCADDITYIRDGKMIYTGSISDFVGTGASLENVMIEQEREAFYEKFTD